MNPMTAWWVQFQPSRNASIHKEGLILKVTSNSKRSAAQVAGEWLRWHGYQLADAKFVAATNDSVTLRLAQ